MVFSKKKSIHQQFVYGLTAVITLTFLIFSAVLISWNAWSSEKKLHEQMERFIALSTQSLASALWQYNNEFVNDYIDSLFLYDSFVFARVETASQIIKSKTRGGYQDIDVTANIDPEKFITQKAQVIFQDTDVGKITLVMTKERIRQQIFNNSLTAISLFFCLIAIIFITIYWLSRKNIFLPIKKLENSAILIAQGNLDIPINVDSNNEIGQLARTLQKMMNRINDITASRDALNREMIERKQVEKLLMSSESRYQSLFNDSPVPLWEEDFTALAEYLDALKEKGIDDFRQFFNEHPSELQLCAGKVKILDVNQASLALHQAETKEALMQGLDKIFTEKSLEVFQEVVIALTGGKLEFESESEVKTLSGTIKHIFLRLLIDTENKDAIKGLLATVDITEHVLLKNQLVQVQKLEAIGRLAGGVAHDYNNVLSIIMGFAELSLQDLNPADPVHANLNEIVSAAKHAADITRQLLAFARKQTIVPKIMNLNHNVEATLNMHRRLIGEDIDLSWLPGKDLWPVKMDPVQIDQILANLCINARDAIAGVGKIRIESQNTTFDAAYCANHPGFTPGEFVMLAVSDNGCGMEKEILDNIFEPFFTTKKVDEGTGLGLATVYGIVKQNSGFINVTSEQGNETTFRIYLPRHMGPVDEKNKRVPSEIPRGQGETVLLVEDDLPLMKLTMTLLMGLGYKVLTANSPEQAIQIAEANAGEIRLLFTDVIMPEMSGRELADQLLSIYPDLKILFMSGYTADIISRRGFIDEGVNFLQKPFSTKDLAKSVRKILDKEY